MTKPYAHQVVICPHVYGPAVTHSTQGATGQGLFQRLSASFGHLTQQGLHGQVRLTKNLISVSFFPDVLPLVSVRPMVGPAYK